VTPAGILVTGGAGFIGAALVRALVGDGHRLRVLDDESRGDFGRLADLRDRIELITGDVRDRDTVVRAASGIDTLIHLASVNGTRLFYEAADRVLEVGLRGMLNVVDACRAHRIDSLFVASSSEVYHEAALIPTDETVSLVIPDVFNPRYSYAGQKLTSELLTLHVARPLVRRAVIFRPHNVYGPDMGFEHVIPQVTMRAARLARGRHAADVVDLPVAGDLAATRAFMHIADFTTAFLALLARAETGVYHVGNPEEVPMGTLAELIGSHFPCRFRTVPVSGSKGGPRRRCPDIGKLRSLGFEPSVPLRQGLGEVVKYYADIVSREDPT
jgi:dTDP-glucose 4,6-dehydratase/UDP-glucose 4-epimerase